jgi:peptidoglycan/xylan/chitin deacetylase (PgdA/CDA1 family)
MLPRKIGRDTEPPVIELTSDPDYVVYPGQEYEEEGYKATDDRDGDLTSQVRWTVEGNTIVYSVSDEAGNVATRTRQIPYAEVSANIAQDGHSAEELAKMRESFPDADETASGSGKVIYLTFDDGPGQYTERLLEILKRNDVHVTFFVTGAFPVYEDMISKEYEAGHSIGIHTLTHDFDKIYASTDAFWKDNNEMQEVVVRQTGHATNLMRFAGGSSNSLGIWQSPGIMEELVNQAQKKGFQYFDWNVSSGDGAAEGDSAMVISRITEQVQNYDTSVVLCHDTKEYTVNAMEYLIPWLLDNGYEIRPLSVDSFPAHHMEPD